MDLITGGAYNSKLAYALKEYNLSKDDFQNGMDCELDNAFSKKGIYNLHLLIKRIIDSGNCSNDVLNSLQNSILNSNMEVVICDEVGSGIIPVNQNDRLMREWTGKTLSLTARHCNRVIRVYYGIPSLIKGSGI